MAEQASLDAIFPEWRLNECHPRDPGVIDVAWNGLWDDIEMPGMPFFGFLDEPGTEMNNRTQQEEPQKVETNGLITKAYRATKRTKESRSHGTPKTMKVDITYTKAAATKNKEGIIQGMSNATHADTASQSRKGTVSPFDFIKDTAAVHELEDINARIKSASTSSKSFDKSTLQHVQAPLDAEEDLLPGLGSTFAGVP
eukprot:jgi/Pico_ML_1/53109/g3717.t1